MRPTTSVAWLYSQVVPGWNISGWAARREMNSAEAGSVGDLGGDIGRLHRMRRRRAGQRAIGQAGGVAQQVLHGRLALDRGTFQPDLLTLNSGR